METLFLKDHGAFHCGCRAVSSYIREEFGRLGNVWTVWPDGIGVPDLIVMNGEGSFHHNYGGQYLRELDRFPESRKVLVNSLWQESNDLVSYLHRFDYIGVRETISQRELQRHGFNPRVFLDFSYYANANVVPVGCYEDQIVMGDHFLAFDSSRFDYPLLPFLSHPTWSGFLSEISGARLYVTGYHHAVYACCKVRTPFVPYDHNSHKIAGLFDMAGVNIPIPTDPDEVEQAIDWAMSNGQEYERLFDFMESYPKWSISEISTKSSS